MRYTFVRWVVLAAGLLAGLAGCWNSADDRVPLALVPPIVVARQAPAATVRLFYDFFIQKEYGATEPLVTKELADSITDDGQRSYAEVQRRQDKTLGYVLRYEILAVRYPDSMTAHVDIDVYSASGIPSEHTTVVVKGSDGWQISGGRWRDIVP